MPDSEIWIGLAEVRQRPGAAMMMDRNEAITNILAIAADEASFRNIAGDACSKLGFDLVELEDAEPLRQRQEQYEVSETLLALAAEVGQDGQPRFGAFHTWTSDDEE